MKKLKLGLIGISEGNGHPYSWSAIFNGYEKDEMANCPFPSIPEYLSRQNFPADFLTALAEVICVWTQDREVSHHIAKASRIPLVVDYFEEMADKVDGILLARDDAKKHLDFAPHFLKRGLPIYIDKPLALTRKDAEYLYSLEKYPGQIFSCSALRYAPEFQLTAQDRDYLGEIISIEARTPKSWEKYAIHIIEPVLNIFDYDVQVSASARFERGEERGLRLSTVQGVDIQFVASGSKPEPISIKLIGSRAIKTLIFESSFLAFRAALCAFIAGMYTRKPQIPKAHNLLAVSLIELGR
ncbi:MAG: Gfo/Idh/MocA family oxidoreductase [Bacteroidota bacterium]